MRPRVHEARDYETASLKLAELIRESFNEYEPDDLIHGAVPVTRTSDGKRLATAIYAHPRGSVERLLGVLWPPITELVS